MSNEQYVNDMSKKHKRSDQAQPDQDEPAGGLDLLLAMSLIDRLRPPLLDEPLSEIDHEIDAQQRHQHSERGTSDDEDAWHAAAEQVRRAVAALEGGNTTIGDIALGNKALSDAQMQADIQAVDSAMDSAEFDETEFDDDAFAASEDASDKVDAGDEVAGSSASTFSMSGSAADTIYSDAMDRPQSANLEEPTQHADPDSTIPVPCEPGEGSSTSPPATGMAELKARLREVEDAGQIRWTSSYRKVREVGRGGQGVVFLTKCIDELSGEQALKIYSPEPYPSPDAYREDMQRMLEVASLVHRIHHDNLVDVQRFVDYCGIYVMVMQSIDGFDVRRLLDFELLEKLQSKLEPDRWKDLDTVIYSRLGGRRVGLQPLLAVNIVEKCLRGVSALHEKGIVHGDIKPSNIMLDSNGSIRLVDIGSAFSYRTPPRQRIWTPRYAPPEFLEHGQWTPESDLASLGYVLIELLTGSADFGGPLISDDSTKQRDQHRDEVLLEAKRSLPERLPSLLPQDVSRCGRLLRLCQKLIDPDPSKRFIDANEAISVDSDGTWHVRMELVRSNLAVYEASEIKHWVADVKRVVGSSDRPTS